MWGTFATTADRIGDRRLRHYAESRRDLNLRHTAACADDAVPSVAAVNQVAGGRGRPGARHWPVSEPDPPAGASDLSCTWRGG
jgi:hypothetical protein